MTGVRHLAGWVRRRRALRRRFNPYVVGAPVFDAALLFGRDPLAARILRLLASRSVRLTGERRIGKTSFLHHLQRSLVSENGAARRFVPVFVDLEAVTASHVLRALMEETVEALAPRLRALAGLRVTRRRDGYDAGDLAHDVKRVVKELRERTRARTRLVLLVDEVDAAFQHPEWGAGRSLEALLDECSEELRVVMAGANGHEGAPGEPSPARGLVEELVLEPLAPDDARSLVTRPVESLFRYEPPAVERILQIGQGRPYLLQKLCLRSLSRMLDDGRTTVRLADVETALGPERWTRPPGPGEDSASGEAAP